MMKRKKLFLSSLLSILVLVSTAGAKDRGDTKLTKTVTRSFSVEKDGALSLENKYGPIVLSTWNKDSVSVEIEITAWGKNDKNVDKLIDRVDFDFNQNSQYLAIITVLDRSSGFFTELWNNVGDYSKTLLSQNKLRIEYTVRLPEGMDLTITNKFGDVYLDDYRGKMKVNLSHGNLRAKKILNHLDLDLSFGSLNMERLESGSLLLKAVEADIEDVGTCELNSSSSEITIGTSQFVQMESKSDRRLTFRSAKVIAGSSRFSKINVETLGEDMRLDLSYGEMKIGALAPGFSRIEIEGRNTDMDLDFASDNYLDFTYVGEEHKLTISEKLESLDVSFVDEKQNVVKMTGTLGTKRNGQGVVIVRSENGEVRIIFG